MTISKVIIVVIVDIYRVIIYYILYIIYIVIYIILEPVQTLLPSAPEELLNTMFCNCKKGAVVMQC